jgi:hypothetical protein
MPKKVVEEARAYYLVETFKDVAKWGESLQDVVNFLLQSVELEAASEEPVCLNVLVWMKNNFDGLAEIQEAILTGFSQHREQDRLVSHEYYETKFVVRSGTVGQEQSKQL